jgi:hypothetical protein
MRAMPAIREENEPGVGKLLLKDERIHGGYHDVVVTVQHQVRCGMFFKQPQRSRVTCPHVPRESETIRAGFSQTLQRSIDAAAAWLRDEGEAARHEEAIQALVTMVSALVLARTAATPKLRDEIPRAARDELLEAPPACASGKVTRHALSARMRVKRIVTELQARGYQVCVCEEGKIS